MSDLRPATDEVIEIVEEETGQNWSISIDKPDYIRLVTGLWRFNVVWDDGSWTLELQDLADGELELDESEWAEGPMQNADEVLRSIPSFIPSEVRV